MLFRFLRFILFTLMVGGAVACNQGNNNNSSDTGGAPFVKDSLIANIRTLASDSFQGRRPFTPGETKTIDYLVRSYSTLVLEPGNGAGYTPDMPLVEISPAAPPTLQGASPQGTVPLQNLNDFVLWTE